MSPARATSSSTLPVPLRARILVMRPLSTLSPSLVRHCTGSPTLHWPEEIRPVQMRPRKVSPSIIVTTIENSSRSSTFGLGTVLTMVSRRSSIFSRGPSGYCNVAQPSRPEAYTVVYSSCSSVAPRLHMRSNTSVSTSSTREVSRSTLLMTTTGLMPRASAFIRTNFVCAIGPSVASTSRHTPSTMLITRSTSPPKSAWPGVSTMLILTPFHVVEVTFDMMVMPRSRSRSMLSMARSPPSSLSMFSLAASSILSTSVVLPWSTCAMIAQLRMLSISILL
mmetsp:Transcript_37065/g.75040  ORF Transcript_37065/g.75040 Transcript_37065/m.75040 type:complete len:279 (+) Transcript_37065:1105-1941(+)